MKTYGPGIEGAVLVGFASVVLANHEHARIYALPEDTHGHPQECERQPELVALGGAFTTNSASATAMSVTALPPGFAIKE